MPATRTRAGTRSSNANDENHITSPSKETKRFKGKGKGKGKGKMVADEEKEDEDVDDKMDLDLKRAQLNQKDVLELAEEILSHLNPNNQSSLYIPKLSQSLIKRANLPLNPRSRASLNTPSITSPSKDKDWKQSRELALDWNQFRNWPEGIIEEREARGEYFRRLKFIHLEQDSKARFLEDCQEDSEIGKEAVVHSSEDVAEKEKEKQTSKEKLKFSKSEAYSILSSISELSKTLLPSYLEFQSNCQELERTLSTINERENELKKFRGFKDSSIKQVWDEEVEIRKLTPNLQHGEADADADAEMITFEIPKERSVPRKGTLTLEEAEKFADLQINDMQLLSSSIDSIKKKIKKSKEELTLNMKSIDRLELEKSEWEKKVKILAQETTTVGNSKEVKRDKVVEKECDTLSSSINVLKKLLSVENLTLISEKEFSTSFHLPLPLSFTSQPDSKEEEIELEEKRRRKANEIERNRKLIVNLKFDQPGGKLIGYSLSLPSNSKESLRPHPLTPYPHDSDAAHARLEAAVKANDPCLLLKEAVGCIERRLCL